VRDRSEGRRKRLYSLLALGWTPSWEKWRHYSRAYLALAALATPLVISVHSVVSWDFAMSINPGWHTTIFAPYFVAGAIHSGLAMVITLLIPLRKALRLERILSLYYFEQMALLLILTGSIVGYSYIVETFVSWYSGNIFERQYSVIRATGPYAPFYWSMIACNVIVPMAFFWKRVRSNWTWLFIIGIVINIGMWLERFVIIVSSLANNFLPSSWGIYAPRPVEICITLGALGLFLLLFLSFVKFFPSVPMGELKETALEGGEEE
jgi:molybdopterin-containing oxidoreductase family membrane subunit